MRYRPEIESVDAIEIVRLQVYRGIPWAMALAAMSPSYARADGFRAGGPERGCHLPERSRRRTVERYCVEISLGLFEVRLPRRPLRRGARHERSHGQFGQSDRADHGVRRQGLRVGDCARRPGALVRHAGP